MRTIISTIIILIISLHGFSQINDAKSNPHLTFYASVGYKRISYPNLYKKFKNEGIAQPTNGFNLGAGAYYGVNRWIVGLEFFNTTASVQNESYLSNASMFTNSIFLGYKFVHTNSFFVAPLLGLSSSTNRLNVHTLSPVDNSPNTTSYRNFDFSSRAGLAIETIAPNGLSVGLTIGYDLSLLTDSKWLIEGVSEKSTIGDSQGGLFINLTLGGHLDLKKSKM